MSIHERTYYERITQFICRFTLKFQTCSLK